MAATPPDRLIPLFIVGAGGFGREAAEAVRAINAAKPAWNVLGFLDDDPSLAGAHVSGTPVVGAVAEALRRPDARVVVTTGRPGDYASRRRLVDRLGLPIYRWATIVHPRASIASSTRVGPGSIVLAGAVATADVTIGAHVALMPQCVLTHDVVIGDFVTLASGVRLSGRVTVGEGAYIGAGAMVREYCSIGAGSLIGMGAVVLEDVPPGQVWVGVPARRLRDVSMPRQAVAGVA
jgi:sugar O-acyltransferase (sialic acid O-acetyltransferase NeuD family)